ncbi:hypothetical protein Vretifemale_13963 [Volvox reticuliferus]|uniref:Transcription initiation factor TFIID component TAF4 C-terminal domain-containing protein n=1 Tax=Volvox reticuliferus TaxID=1737510 RepID=A0A8J4FSQ5_9CHLO|nr:hypothetical protein Vretifemale_13963 [Volvox reticuliferus]
MRPCLSYPRPSQEEYVLNEDPTLVRVRDVARKHGMRRLAPDVFPYLALAAEAHLSGLLRSVGRLASQRGDPGRHAVVPATAVARSGVNAQHHIQRLRKVDEVRMAAKKEQEEEALRAGLLPKADGGNATRAQTAQMSEAEKAAAAHLKAKEVQKAAQAKAQATLSTIFSGIKRKKTFVTPPASAAAKPLGMPGSAAPAAAPKAVDGASAAGATAAGPAPAVPGTAAPAQAATAAQPPPTGSSMPPPPPLPKGPVHIKVVDLISVMSTDPQLNKSPLLYTWQAQESFREYNRESVAR